MVYGLPAPGMLGPLDITLKHLQNLFRRSVVAGSITKAVAPGLAPSQPSDFNSSLGKGWRRSWAPADERGTAHRESSPLKKAPRASYWFKLSDRCFAG